MAEIFRRIEKKYILTKEQYEKLQDAISQYMVEDQYGKSTICNIYFDSNQYQMISHSIEKPFFKEKVRLRSYNTPTQDSKVYLEIKRKCDGIVGKRRIEMRLREFNQYLNDSSGVYITNQQIKSELDYYFKMYQLRPAMYISYTRTAYYQKDNPDFRLTFDSNVLARKYDLNLDGGEYGNQILENDKYIMEIKTLNSIPLWLVEELTKLKIVPGSFSKYGTAYEKLVLEPILLKHKISKRIKGEENCVVEFIHDNVRAKKATASA
ncbi:MAG: polyphosphate polymerase domain-containing protein [Clostridia bacterium]|nr:polyphosphate polymerase domain-containing protein [Clostridia bacterium]